MYARALRRRYGSSNTWERTDGGYELRVSDDLVYRVQPRKALTAAQKWKLDQHLGLARHHRREAWVIMINGTPYYHAYDRATAIHDADEKIGQLQREREARRSRERSGPQLGIGLVQQQTWLPSERSVEDTGFGREDMRVLAEHLPELRQR